MDPIVNLRCLLDGNAAQWIPFTLDVGAMPGFTEPIQQKFEEAAGAQDAAEYFACDFRRFSLSARFGGADPAALHDSVEPGTTFDEWGIGHLKSDTQGSVDRTFCPLANAQSAEDVEVLPSPIVETDVDTSPIDAYHAAGYPVWGYGGSIYEWSWWLRGMEAFMMDLVSDPDVAQAVLGKVTDHTTRLAIATARAGVDILCFYDDAGTQRGMQISPNLWRQFIKPAWKHVLDSVRNEVPDTAFFLHSCGKIDAILPDIVEVGFDILHPIQPECMDFEAIYRQYGREIVVAATISSQQLFPFGSVEEIRAEVRRLAEIVSESRRCVLMPSNMFQPETPWENIAAFAAEARAVRDAVDE